MSYTIYTDEFKEKVVKEYLAGARPSDLAAKYEVNNTQISDGVSSGKSRDLSKIIEEKEEKEINEEIQKQFVT